MRASVVRSFVPNEWPLNNSALRPLAAEFGGASDDITLMSKENIRLAVPAPEAKLVKANRLDFLSPKLDRDRTEESENQEELSQEVESTDTLGQTMKMKK